MCCDGEGGGGDDEVVSPHHQTMPEAFLVMFFAGIHRGFHACLASIECGGHGYILPVLDNRRFFLRRIHSIIAPALPNFRPTQTAIIFVCFEISPGKTCVAAAVPSPRASTTRRERAAHCEQTQRTPRRHASYELLAAATRRLAGTGGKLDVGDAGDRRQDRSGTVCHHSPRNAIFVLTTQP